MIEYTFLTSMSDQGLISKTKAAKKAAHEALLGEVTDINKHGKPTGERFITNYTNAYSNRANEWIALLNECSRRGIAVSYD